MEAPKCKLCGERHYGLCKAAKELVDAPKAKYDRNTAHRAYMRDYMRKRRAADKARKEQK